MSLKFGELAVDAVASLLFAISNDNDKHDGVEDEESSHNAHRQKHV